MFSSSNSAVAQQHPDTRRKQGFNFNTLLQLFKFLLLFTNVSFLRDLYKSVSIMWLLPTGLFHTPPASPSEQEWSTCTLAVTKDTGFLLARHVMPAS